MTSPQHTLELEARPEVIGGRWEIVAPLADGGMGKIYVAQHVRTGKKAALKVLERDDIEAQARFRLEARVSAELNHPGLVDVFDADVDPKTGRCYMAMELLEGRTLRKVMDDEDETPLSLLALLMQVLEPLAVAHSRGYVHRDLKPENIFVSQGQGGERQVKLLDFGIAGHELRKGLTLTGTAMGTPHYMSPEQVMDASAALPSSDVWSMGVLLYEALSGRVPFVGDGAHAVVVRVCTEDPTPLTEVAGGIAPPLAALVMRCLAKDPAARPQHAGLLQSQLKLLGHPDSIPAHRIPQHPSVPGDLPVTSSVRTRQGFHATIDRSVFPRPPVHLGTSLAGAAVLALALFGRATDTVDAGALLLLGLTGAGLALTGLLLRPRPDRVSLLELPTPVRRGSGTSPEDGPPAITPLVMGACDGPIVTIELFTDLCSTAARRLAERALSLAQREGVVTLLHILPSGTGSGAIPMAEIVEELRTRHGDPIALGFIQDLLAVRKRVNEGLVLDLAHSAGAHMVSLRHALRVQMHARKVEKLKRSCIQRGILQTPTVLVAERAVHDLTPAGLSRAVELALTQALAAREAQSGAETTRIAVPKGVPAQMNLRRIVVCFDDAVAPPKAVRRSRAQARERAEKLRARACLPGTDFGDVAMRFGDADLDMGTVDLEDLPPVVLEAVATLRVGEVSELIEGTEGFVVVQRLS